MSDNKYCVVYNRKRDNKEVRTRISSLKKATERLETLESFGIIGKIRSKKHMPFFEKRSNIAVRNTNICNHWRFVPYYDKELNHIRTDCLKNGAFVKMERCMY